MDQRREEAIRNFMANMPTLEAFISKYSVVTAPDRSRNSPRNLEAFAMANASLILLIMSV
jgi:hypothetical protein